VIARNWIGGGGCVFSLAKVACRCSFWCRSDGCRKLAGERQSLSSLREPQATNGVGGGGGGGGAAGRRCRDAGSQVSEMAIARVI
jgi:hypothetical protein